MGVVMNKVKAFIISAGIVFTASVSAFAGCNYTTGQLQAQLPFQKSKMTIQHQKQLTKDVCEIIVKTQTRYGTRFLPFYTVKGKGIIIGTLFKNKQNITGQLISKMQSEQAKKVFASVKKELHKIVVTSYKPKNANGKVLYGFVDPLCPFCTKAESQLKGIADQSGYTIKLIPFIVHGEPAKNKVESFVCSKTKKTFLDYTSGNFGNAKSCSNADNMIKEAKNIAVKLGINGTPTFFTSDGTEIVGANMPLIKQTLGVK